MIYANGGLNTPVVTTIADNLRSLGSIDSNYFYSPTDAGIVLEMYETAGGPAIPSSPYSLNAWQALSGYDMHTKKPAQKVQPYTLINTIGNNLFSNPQFTSNINGVTMFSSNATAAWDNTGKISGSGSLRVNFSSHHPGRFCQLSSPIGSVNNSKKYIIRFNTTGTTPNGIVRAYLKKSTTPFNEIIAVQSRAFGMGKTAHEFLLVGPNTETAASLVIGIEEGSGTTFIDDIEVYEVNATINSFSSQVRFEYNATDAVKTILLDAKYIGVDSTVYNGTLTLQPYSSRIIIKGGPVDSTPVVNAGLDQVISLPMDSVILSGIAKGGTNLNYTWTKIAGPAQFSLANAGIPVCNGKPVVVDTFYR
jgi:hypothetical protein